MTLLKARPTTYRGIQMRSRLEARFAAGLDSLGARWVYEPRAFADGHAQYLPDFQIGGHTFIEVKPTVEHAIDALGKGDVIFASVPDAVFAVACADLRNFLLVREADVAPWKLASHTLGGWARWDYGSGPEIVVKSLDSTSFHDPESALHHEARLIASGAVFLDFDWSWQ